MNLDKERVPLSTSERSERKGMYPYYGAQGIIDRVDAYIFDGTYLLIAEDGENLKSRKENIAQIVSGKFWANNHVHIVSENGQCDIRYLCYYLNFMDITPYVTGSVQPKLNQSNLNAIHVPVPPLETQRQIAAVLGALDDKIETNDRIIKNLQEQVRVAYRQTCVLDTYGKPVCLSNVAGIQSQIFNPQQEPEQIVEHYSIPAFDENQFPVLESSKDIKPEFPEVLQLGLGEC